MYVAATLESRLIRKIDEVKIAEGAILANLNQFKESTSFADQEFKIFSQWGEDGIIQFLVRNLEIPNKTFIEFGMDDFSESNCRFLLMKDDWQGFLIDGSETHLQRLESSYYFWKHSLRATRAFITKENINSLLEESGFDYDLGLLSIDLDGVDYFIFEAIARYKPRILILEFNKLFGDERKITIPYNCDFERAKAHHSWLYYGASLAAMADLAKKKGYSLIGTPTAGANAFFVRNDLLNKKIRRREVKEVFIPSNIREARDTQGNLSYLLPADGLKLISGLPVLNIETGHIEPL